MIRAPIESTIGTLDRVLRAAQVDSTTLAAVLLVGGSSRIPLVAQMVSEAFGRPTVVGAHPKHAVALGAALLARPAGAGSPRCTWTAPTRSGHPRDRSSPSVGRPRLCHVKRRGTHRATACTSPLPPGRGCPTPSVAAGAPAAASAGVLTGPVGGGPATGDVVPPGHVPTPRAGEPSGTAPPAAPPPEGRRTGRCSGGRFRTGRARTRGGSRYLALLVGLVLLVVAAGVAVYLGTRPDDPSGGGQAATPLAHGLGVADADPAGDGGPDPVDRCDDPGRGNPRLRRRRTERPAALHRQPGSRRGHRRRHGRGRGDGDHPDRRRSPAVHRFQPRRPPGVRERVGQAQEAGRSRMSSSWTRRRTRSSQTVPVDTRPFLAAVSPDGTWIYVPNHDTDSVSVIDAATFEVVTTIEVAPNPHWVAFTPDGSKAYTANHDSNVVSAIDTATNTVTAEIPVPKSPHSIAVHPTRPILIVATYDADSASVIDTNTDTVLTSIPVGPLPAARRLVGRRPVRLHHEQRGQQHLGHRRRDVRGHGHHPHRPVPHVLRGPARRQPGLCQQPPRRHADRS